MIMAQIRLRNNRDVTLFNPLGTTLLSISHFLARILIEHTNIICSLESELQNHLISFIINLPSSKDKDKKSDPTYSRVNTKTHIPILNIKML